VALATPFDLPDPLAGGGSAWLRWADEVDPLGERHSWRDWSSPTYTYGQAPHSGIEFDPLPQGTPYEPTSSLTGWAAIGGDLDSWMRANEPAWAQFGDVGRAVNPGEIASPNDPSWANVNRWDGAILGAIRKVATETGVYVPANLVKSIMHLESGGVHENASPQDAYGLMQIMPMWNGTWGLDYTDPLQNIELGVRILVDNYNAGDPATGEKSWEWATRRYLGLGGPDALGTDHNTYWAAVSQRWSELNAFGGGGSTGGATTPPPNTEAYRAIWGGIDAVITQEYGPTEFAAANPSWSSYGGAYTEDGQPMGHPGIDVGVSAGTVLYAPLAGTVVCAGTGVGNGADSCSAYESTVQMGDGAGRFQIMLDNGDMLIYGHIAQSLVQPGQRVNPGDAVARSGSQNGDHLHLEYRKYLGPPNTGTSSGYLMVDPRAALGGGFTGSFRQPGPVQFVASATDWNAFMRNAAQGLPVTGAATVGGFHDWLREQMGVGSAPRVFAPEGPPAGWAFGAGAPPPVPAPVPAPAP
jgi:murein DD-endopeptidase MepM/ murein hydrolase activator NlpD